MKIHFTAISTKIMRTIAYAAFAVAISSCMTDEYSDGIPGDGYLHLTFTKTDTKASVGTDGSGNFTEGDKIGLYIGNGTSAEYRELTFDGTEWQPLLKRSEFGEGDLTLSAHYPVMSDGTETSCTFGIPQDQTGEDFESADILVSDAVVPEGKYSAGMSFRHAMHRIRIELEGSAENADPEIRTLESGSVNLLSGTASADNNGKYIRIKPAKKGGNVFEAIIYPQSAEPYRDGDGLIIISANGKEQSFKAPETTSGGSPLDFFEAGKETTVKLNIKTSSDIDQEWANRSVWLLGINPPEEGAWVQLFPQMYTTYYLPWKEEYGWYDCNKRNPTANPDLTPDGMMCWAASASNMLHWWIAQNKEYIDRYDYTGPDYSYPLDKPQESDIFQCFIDSFNDKAGYIDEGLNWFIHGIKPSYPPYDYPVNEGGYFKDVFPSGVKLGNNYGGLSKNRFNEVIKDALKNDKGLGFNLGETTSSHAVTMWGVEFDEEGYVSCVYMADNNDRDYFDDYGVGCVRLEIVYVTLPEGGDITHYKSGFISETIYTYPINRLYTLDLGREYWEQYFQENKNN